MLALVWYPDDTAQATSPGICTAPLRRRVVACTHGLVQIPTVCEAGSTVSVYTQSPSAYIQPKGLSVDTACEGLTGCVRPADYHVQQRPFAHESERRPSG